MRRILILLLACNACKPSSGRAVSDADLPPRALAQTSLAPAPSEVGVVFQCLQDDSGSVRLTGILRQRLHSTRPAAGRASRIDTAFVLETPIRTVDCQSRAGGQPPRELEPRSPVSLLGAAPALSSFLGDTVVVFGTAAARPALLDSEPMQMRLDSMRVVRGGSRTMLGANGELRP